MTRLMKSSFLWQFAGGFVLGGLGLLAFHPAEATTLIHNVHAVVAPLQ